MDFHHEVAYPVPPQACLDLFADHDFAVERATRSGGRNVKVTIEHVDDTIISTTERGLPTGSMPKVVTRVVGPTIQTKQTDTWHAAGPDGVIRGTFTVHISGVPVSFSGRMELDADGEGAREVVDATISAHVPLVGGKLARILAEQASRQLDFDARLATEWQAR